MTNDEKRRVFKAYFLYGILGAKDEIYCLTGNEFESDFIEAKFAGMDAAKKHKARALMISYKRPRHRRSQKRQRAYYAGGGVAVIYEIKRGFNGFGIIY